MPLPRRSTSAIAKLEKPLRDEINRLILDGIEYKEIAKKFAEKGVHLTARKLSAWRRRDHQFWLRDQERLDEMKAVREFTMQLVRENAGGSIQEASLLIAASQMYELLVDFNPKALKAKLAKDPQFYARLLPAITRLGEGGLKFERYRAEVEKTKAKLEAGLEEARAAGMSDEAVANLQAILKLL